MDLLQVSRPSRQSALDRHPQALAWGLGLLGAIIGGAGSWAPSYWGDEAASVMSASRPWPSLMTLLGTIDGVHGVYYALLRLWTSVFGTSELAARAPSAIAVGLMVTGVVIVARDYLPVSVAASAGIVAIVLPRATYMATEARSYAMSAAVAVWLTLLLSRALGSSAKRRVWIGYAVAAAAGRPPPHRSRRLRRSRAPGSARQPSPSS